MLEAASCFGYTAHCLSHHYVALRYVYRCVSAQATGEHARSHSDSRLKSTKLTVAAHIISSIYAHGHRNSYKLRAP